MAFKVKIYSMAHFKAVVNQLADEGFTSEETRDFYQTYAPKITPSYIVVDEQEKRIRCFYNFDVRNVPAKWKYKSLRINSPEEMVNETLITATRSLMSSAGEIFHTNAANINTEDVEDLLYCCKEWLQKHSRLVNLEKYS